MEFKVLVIDDSEDDTFLFRKMMSKSGMRAEVTNATQVETGFNVLANNTFDCIFLDYSMPVMDGLEFLKKIRSNGIDTPVIMLTGQKNEQTIVKLMQEGASDYIPKQSLNSDSLRLSIENAQRLHQIKREKLLAEEALKASESRLAEAQQIAHIGNWEYDYQNNTLFLSEEAHRITESSPGNASPQLLEISKKIHPDDSQIIENCLRNFRQTHSCDINLRFIPGNGFVKHLNIKYRTVLNEGKTVKIVGTVQDITLLKNALTASKKATVKSRATTIVFTVAIGLFLLSEAILDPFIDSMTASLLISLSFKGSIALMLKPVEIFLEKLMLSKVLLS